MVNDGQDVEKLGKDKGLGKISEESKILNRTLIFITQLESDQDSGLKILRAVFQ